MKKDSIPTSIKTRQNVDANINWNNYFIKQFIST